MYRKILFIFFTCFFFLSTANSWELDPSFGGDGIVIHHNAAGGNGDDSARDIIFDSNNRILITGYSFNGNNFDMVLWRFNEDGSLDTTFSNKGWVIHNSAAGGNTNDYGMGINIDNSNRILVTGDSRGTTTGPDMALWRFNPDGSLDTSFSNKGWVIHHNAGGANSLDYGRDVIVDKSNKILVAGYSYGTFADMTIWRYNNDGSLDTSFSNKGWVTHHNAAGGGRHDNGHAIAIDTNDKIIIIGSSDRAFVDPDLAIWRYNPDGSLDTSFSNKGWVTHHNAGGGNGSDEAVDGLIDADGKILAAGHSIGIANDLAIWRYNTDGSHDTSFSNKGWVIHHNAAGGNGWDLGTAVTLDQNGKIVVAGYSYNGSDYDMIVWRYNSDGSIDANFNSKGWIVLKSLNGADEDDYGHTIAIDNKNRIVIAGYSGNGADTDMVICRLIESAATTSNGAVVLRTGVYPNYLDISKDEMCRIVIKEPGNAQIMIYNMTGVLVKKFPRRYFKSGDYEIWGGLEQNSDRKVGSGVYMVIIEGDNVNKKLKMVIKK